MNKNIINEIIKICNPEDPSFYAGYLENKTQKNQILKDLFHSNNLREKLELKSSAILKVAYVTNSYDDFLFLKESLSYQKMNPYSLNVYLSKEEIDEIVFDIVIYDNLCFDDLKEYYTSIKNIVTPRIMLFDENCNFKI